MSPVSGAISGWWPIPPTSPPRRLTGFPPRCTTRRTSPAATPPTGCTPALADTDTLAWARFHWRVDTVLTGDTCYCGIYEPIRDSVLGSMLVITKGMYDNTTETKSGDVLYREFGRWINLRGGKVPVPGDSLHHTYIPFNATFPATPTDTVRCDSLFQQ